MYITPLLPDEAFRALPQVLLPSLQGNPEAGYTALQAMLLPYLDAIQLGWWLCLIVTMGYMIARYIAVPIIRGNQGSVIHAEKQRGFVGFYRRIFSIDEFANDVLVRWFAGAVLLGFLVTFTQWQANPATTLQGVASYSNTCWPFFQSCRDWVFLEAFPAAYSQMIFFMVLFALIVVSAWALVTQRYVVAHASILLLFAAKLYLTLINFFYNGNYDYYHTTFCIVLLFLPHKRFFASLSVAMLYVLSTVAKIHPGWTLGLYFTSLKPGMPIFTDAVVPLMTNLVIAMEMVGTWFLFSRKIYVQRCVFFFFCVFHLYSGALVGYHYPTMVMPALLICFGSLFVPFSRVPLDRTAITGWIFMVMLWALQLVAVVIPGDAKLTLEGNFYGLYMFEANHQCHSYMRHENGTMLEQRNGVTARYRCDPWPFLASGQQRYCSAADAPKIQFYMIHSINGGPFYEIVNEKDMCALRYEPFTHNAWIKDARDAKILGRPLKNLYD